MNILLNTFWFVWEIKYVLFWLYLWQLKDYHFGRFIDHFRTSKGKKIFLNLEQIIKIILLVFLFLTRISAGILAVILLFLYVGEALLLLRGIIYNSVKKPKKTLKIIFLTIVSFVVVLLFLSWVPGFGGSLQPTALLFFDILTPIIISLIVFLFQPIFVFLRNITLQKAKNKLDKIKSVGGLKVIAITGSYGKTSTKEFLSSILSKKFKVVSTKDHQNSEIGVAKCILNELKSGHNFFIAEVGAYNKGKVKEVCSILKPKYGIVTGVNEQHLALFGSLENLLSAEGGEELADSLPTDGMLFVNGDNKYCMGLYRKFEGKIPFGAKAKIYSLDNKKINSDIWAESITVHENKISFVAINKAGEMSHFGVNVLGKHNVQNLLGAILIAKELGMSLIEISEACKDISQKQSGMTLFTGKHNINIIDSSYSANPDGVFADLEYLSIFSGKKVVVMPCLIELGEKSSMIHEKIGRKIGEICDLAIITNKDKFNELKDGFNEKKKDGAKCLLCDKPKDIFSEITTFCKAGDAVLLEGRVPAGLLDLLK